MSSLYAMPRNLVLAASAGTGKTHALVGVVLHLFVTDRKGKKPIDPSRVVATTFSRKAAAEIRSRVATELERLAATPASSVYFPTFANLTPAEIQRRARRAIGRLAHARFGTLHSFATGIVRQYAFELGLGPGFDLATEADARARAEDAIAGAIERRLSTQGDLIRALAEAAGGIEPFIGQLRRILGQLEEDGRSARDLALATEDPSDLERAARTFVDHARALMTTPKFDLAAREVVHAWTTNNAKRFEAAAAELGGIAVRGKKTPEVEAFAVFRSQLPGQTNEERARRLARSWRARASFAVGATLVRDVLAEAEAEIERTGRARATLGFGEILRSARALLRDRSDVAEEIASGLDALLVDEFQDTSRVQRDLLQLLWARPEMRERGRVPELSMIRKEGLLVVGDRKQSIYGFRGADVGVFAELAVGLAGRPAREALGIPAGVTWEPKEPLADFHALRENRRSVAPILSFANAFSATRFRPGEPPPAELFEIEYVARTEDLLVPNETGAPEAPTGLQASLEKSLGLAIAGSPRTTWLRIAPKGASSTHLDEALVIGERIEKLARESGVAWRDIAVLATTNGMLDAVAFALAQANIPYVVSGKSFYRTREVRDLRAMLALVLDPHDRHSALEVLRGPWAAVHDETLLGLLRPEGLSPPEGWGSPYRPELVRAEDKAAIAATADLVLSLAKVAGKLSPGTILREAVKARSLREVLGAMPRGEQRIANMEKLLATADRHADARAFRSWLDEAMAQEITESEAATFSEEDDAVRLLTVHASKGLDFPIVFIPEIGAALPRTEKGAVRVALGAADAPNVLSIRIADEGGFVLEPPSFARAYATARRRERAERQRLAYVAVTRAARAMFLVGGRKQKSETAQDPGMSTLAALEELKDHPSLAVEDVEVPAASMRQDDPNASAANDASTQPATTSVTERTVPAWRSLPIAPTALADFDHCARRFELIHLLGLPEHVRGQKSGGKAGSLDARAQGTLAHAVLERIPPEAFAADGPEHASRILVAEGVPAEHPQHDAIVARVVRFLDSTYARSIAERGASLRREVPFVLDVTNDEDQADPQRVVLRGSMDLVVVWPDGAIDVVDYKSARAPVDRTSVSAGYAFQLDVYALAARTLFPSAGALRAGLVFLGGGSGEPIWRTLPSEATLRARLATLGNELVESRWRDRFPRVALERCEAIHCGFIGRCHPNPNP